MTTFFIFWFVTGLVLTQITVFLLVEHDRLATYFNTHCGGDYPLNLDEVFSLKDRVKLYALGVLAGPLTLITAHAAYLDWRSVK